MTKSALLTPDELKRQERESIATALKRTGGKVFGPGGAAELLDAPALEASRYGIPATRSQLASPIRVHGRALKSSLVLRLTIFGTQFGFFRRVLLLVVDETLVSLQVSFNVTSAINSNLYQLLSH